MPDELLIALEAVDEKRNCRRHWRAEIGRDLLGDLVLSVTYGRLGCSGRTVRYPVSDAARGSALLRQALRRRASAPRRIGVAYRVVVRNESALNSLG